MTSCIELNLTFFRKLIEYFTYSRMKFALFFRFFDSWYIIKYLLTETSGKQYVLWTLDCRCFPRLRLGKHRQSVSVNKCQMCPPPLLHYKSSLPFELSVTNVANEKRNLLLRLQYWKVSELIQIDLV